jgi:hypothetical protein
LCICGDEFAVLIGEYAPCIGVSGGVMPAEEYAGPPSAVVSVDAAEGTREMAGASLEASSTSGPHAHSPQQQQSASKYGLNGASVNKNEGSCNVISVSDPPASGSGLLRKYDWCSASAQQDGHDCAAREHSGTQH